MEKMTVKSIALKKLMNVAQDLMKFSHEKDDATKTHVMIQLSTEIILAISDLRDDEFLAPEEAAEILKTTKGYLQNQRFKNEGFPYYKVERKIYYKKHEILSIINKSRVDVKN